MAKRTGISFERLCYLVRLPAPVPEFKFHPTRKWRFDYAWPGVFGGVALEVQGGLFVQGRHSRGAALLKEHEKLNEAAALGWRIVFCTPSTLESAATFDLLRRAIL